MGGIGSGRWGAAPTVESVRQITIADLRKRASFRVEEVNHITVNETMVRVDKTPCNYGGERLWFLCPDCTKRVGILYERCGVFRCRTCCGLKYSSQCESPIQRQLRKVGKIRNRLNMPDKCQFQVTNKPYGMHWTTFSRLYLAEEEALTKARLLLVKSSMAFFERSKVKVSY